MTNYTETTKGPLGVERGLDRHWKAFLSDNPSETEVYGFVLSRLTNQLDIKTEVTGDHINGKIMRIDAIASGEHKGVPFHFGIEFKGPREILKPGNVFAQCAAYANTRFRGYGRIPIFVCPGIFDPIVRSAAEWERETCSAAFRLRDTFFVGDVRCSPEFGITFQNQHGEIWSQRGGITGLGVDVCLSRKTEKNKAPEPNVFQRTGDGLFVADFYLHYDEDGNRVRRRLYSATRSKLEVKIKEFQNELMGQAAA